MMPEEVRAAVTQAIAEVQKLGGHACPDIEIGLRPIGQLEGFDSLISIEATVIVETKLGCDLGIESIFVSEDGGRSLSIDEVVERVMRVTAEARS
jgi:formylmethanofuran dehydrogenase subunit E